MDGANEELLNANPFIIPIECTKKILEQMEKCICKIKIDNKKGTGFFCKIPFPDKNNMIPVFITNNHIINNINEEILIYIEEECKERKILINNDRKIYMSDEKKYDITMIEIKEEDNIKNYLELDEKIMDDILNSDNYDKNDKYIDRTVYIIQYPEGELSVSYGLIQNRYEDKLYDFQHSCSTRSGSSGSPILNLYNNKLIGIHKKGTPKYNIGTFLNEPIKEFISQNIKNKITISNYIKNYNDFHINEIDLKHENKKYCDALLKTEPSVEEDISNKFKEQIKFNFNIDNNYNIISNFNSNSAKKLDIKSSKLNGEYSKDIKLNSSSLEINKQIPLTSRESLYTDNIISKKIEKKNFQKIPSQYIKTNLVFITNGKGKPNKTKRYDDDKKTKFNLEIVNKNFLTKLKEQCKDLFTKNFSEKIFSFKFSEQVEAFNEMNDQLIKKINIPIYFDNLDLILKIIGIKMLDNSNTKLIKSLLEFLDSLFLVISEKEYQLNETESNIIISILINNLSLNNILKESVLSILGKYIEYLDTNKIMVIVINIALNKTNKIKTVILDLVNNLVSNKKLNVSTKVYAKLLFKFLVFNDNIIKTKTISLFQEIYKNIGKELWKIKEIPDKDKEFLKKNLHEDVVEEEDEEAEEEEDEEENEDEIEIGNKKKEKNNNLENKINNDINNNINFDLNNNINFELNNNINFDLNNNEINYSEGGNKNDIISNNNIENNNIMSNENKKLNKKKWKNKKKKSILVKMFR